MKLSKNFLKLTKKGFFVLLFTIPFHSSALAQATESWPDYTVEELIEKGESIGSLLGTIFLVPESDMLKITDQALALYDANGGDADKFLMPDVYLMRNIALSGQEKYDEALAVSKELKEKGFAVFDTKNLLKSEAYALIGEANVISSRDKDYKKAKGILIKSIDRLPTFYGYKFKALMHQLLDERDSILMTYTLALEAPFAPTAEKASMYERRGRLYFEQKLYSKALEDYNSAIEFGPTCISNYYRARCYLLSNQFQDKSVANKDLLYIANNECGNLGAGPLSYVHEKLADHYQDTRDYSKAYTYYANSYNYRPYYYNSGWAAISAGAMQRSDDVISWANKFFTAVGNAQPHNYVTWLTAEVYYSRAYAYWRKKNQDAVIRDLEKSKSLGNKRAASDLQQYFNR